MKLKKERHELVFRIQWNICDGAFLQNQLTTKNFIVDIPPGSKHPSDEQNKLFSFQIKATFKDTTLGIRMRSTKLLLWKKKKGWTRFPMTLYEWDSTADIFLGIFKYFFDKLFHKTAPNH